MTPVSGAGAVTFEKSGQKVKERRSFEITGGMCPACEGLGQVSDIDLDELLDRSLSLAAGAIRVPGYNPDGRAPGSATTCWSTPSTGAPSRRCSR